MKLIPEKRGRPTEDRTNKIIKATAEAIVRAKKAGKPVVGYFRLVALHFWPDDSPRAAMKKFRIFRNNNRTKIAAAVRNLG